MQRQQLLFAHIFTLLLGGFIYLFFRMDGLIMFKWLENHNNLILKLRKSIPIHHDSLPNWFLYSLPDGLWLFSYVSLVLLIWKNRITWESSFWIIVIPILIVFAEIGQLCNIVPGTFDLVDIAFYLLGAILPIIILKIIQLKTKMI